MHLILFLLFLLLPQDCSHVAWGAQCNEPHTYCIYSQNNALGCDTGYGCTTCYRGFNPNGPIFVGKFDSYEYKNVTNIRFVITDPGDLVKYGVNKGDVISRINNIRLKPEFFDKPTLVDKDTLTIYTPNKLNSVRVIIYN